MGDVPNYITPEGFKKLADELIRLRVVDRPKVCQEVSDAAALGDRSENAEYIYGKKKLREIDRRMRWLTKRVDTATIIDPKTQKGERVFFGATVEVEDDEGKEHTFLLVGEDEIDAAKGRISWKSPIGSALLRKSVDDEVKVRTPNGVRGFTITDVKYR